MPKKQRARTARFIAALVVAVSTISSAVAGTHAAEAADSSSSRPSAPVITRLTQRDPDRIELAFQRRGPRAETVAARILRNGVELTDVIVDPESAVTQNLVLQVPAGRAWVQVIAINPAGNESVRSAPVMVLVDTLRATAPSVVSAVFNEQTRCVDITFRNSADRRGIGTYYIWINLQRRDSLLGSTPSDAGALRTTSLCRSDLGSGRRYIQMTADRVSGESVRSAPVSVVIQTANPIPTGFAAALAGEELTLSWDRPDQGTFDTFDISDAGRNIAFVDSDQTSVTMPRPLSRFRDGRHWFQIRTLTRTSGQQSARTSPIFVLASASIPQPATLLEAGFDPASGCLTVVFETSADDRTIASYELMTGPNPRASFAGSSGVEVRTEMQCQGITRFDPDEVSIRAILATGESSRSNVLTVDLGGSPT